MNKLIMECYPEISQISIDYYHHIHEYDNKKYLESCRFIV